jgi:acyl carrier protein
MENIIEKIVSIIKKTKKDIDISKITTNAKFIEDLNFDSLEVVELVIDLEDEFGIDIEDKQTSDITTVQDLANKVKELVDKK